MNTGEGSTAGRSPFLCDFFIAHAGPDKPTAELLRDLLIRGHARVFLDRDTIPLGDDWDAKLASGQQTSFVTVVLVSSKTPDAYYEREEIATAIAMARADGQRHRVVPLYLDAGAAANPPYGLRLKEGRTLGGDYTLADFAAELLELLETQPAPGGGGAAAPVFAPRGILLQPAPDWRSPVRESPARYKVAAFDLDGTLLRGDKYEFSWEVVWKALGFVKAVQNELKREYRQRIDADPSRSSRVRAYGDWCEQACEQFKRRGLTREQLRDMSRAVRLTANCRQALAELKAKGVTLAVISGGVHTFLEDVFADYRQYFDFVFVNELLFSASGALEGVRSTPYDFQGKAEALELVCERVGCTTAEAVFVGDQFNDEAIMAKAALAIAYPPGEGRWTGSRT